jgi:hypothetical protein
MMIRSDEDGACRMLPPIGQVGNDALDRSWLEISAKLYPCDAASLTDIEVTVVHIEAGGIMQATHEGK